jgi:membrane-associated phospholipid phosphatase
LASSAAPSRGGRSQPLPALPALVVGAAAALAALLALLAWTSPGWLADSVDRPVLRAVADHRSPIGIDAMRVITHLGDLAVLFPVGVLVVVLLGRQGGGRRSAGVAAIGMLGTDLCVEVTKALVHRRRPPSHLALQHLSSWSMPSGHATMSVVVWGLFACTLAGSGPLRHRRTPIVLAAAALAVVVGVSRVYLGVHWPTDVVAGWLAGAVALRLTLRTLGAVGVGSPSGRYGW